MYIYVHIYIHIYYIFKGKKGWEDEKINSFIQLEDDTDDSMDDVDYDDEDFTTKKTEKNVDAWKNILDSKKTKKNDSKKTEKKSRKKTEIPNGPVEIYRGYFLFIILCISVCM
jgi:hypothetical protein